VFRRPKVLAWLLLSALLLAAGWVAFIWAVNHGRVLDTALGYYITPLMSMAAGALLFRERLDRVAQLAIGLAVAGVALQAAALGDLPLLSLLLAFSFAAYGVVRKQVAADAQTGLFVESVLGAPLALAYIVWLQRTGQGHFADGPATTAMLIGSGVVNGVPLLLFAWAARRMPLSALGFLQFLSPTIGFVLGVLQGEPLTRLRVLSFVFIWAGAAVFTVGAWRRSRRVAVAAEPGVA
jgi:chloramphenicol-sensitive protein RarD